MRTFSFAVMIEKERKIFNINDSFGTELISATFVSTDLDTVLQTQSSNRTYNSNRTTLTNDLENIPFPFL